MSPRAKAHPRSSRAGFRRRSGSLAKTSSGSASAGRRASEGRRAAFQPLTTRSWAALRPHQGLLFSWFLRLHSFPKLIARCWAWLPQTCDRRGTASTGWRRRAGVELGVEADDVTKDPHVADQLALERAEGRACPRDRL